MHKSNHHANFQVDISIPGEMYITGPKFWSSCDPKFPFQSCEDVKFEAEKRRFTAAYK